MSYCLLFVSTRAEWQNWAKFGLHSTEPAIHTQISFEVLSLWTSTLQKTTITRPKLYSIIICEAYSYKELKFEQFVIWLFTLNYRRLTDL